MRHRSGTGGKAAGVVAASESRIRTSAPALALAGLAPTIGEFFLGNLTIDKLPMLVLFVPLYGGGALFIRETIRRAGRGWPSMALLAAAYGLIEEGPVDQLLWNPTYGGAHDALAGDAYLPALGTNVSLVQAVVSLHAIWSICVPIALVEALFPERRTTPWLGRKGLGAAAMLFGAGVTLGFVGTRVEDPFRASPVQHSVSIAVIAILIVVAFTVPQRLPAAKRRAPRAWHVGVATLLLTSAMLVLVMFWPTDWSQWTSVITWCIAAGALSVGLIYWSRCQGWDAMHRLAAAAGAMATYAWIAFPHQPVGGGARAIDLAGNIACAVAAAVLITLAGRRIAHYESTSGDTGA